MSANAFDCGGVIGNMMRRADWTHGGWATGYLILVGKLQSAASSGTVHGRCAFAVRRYGFCDNALGKSQTWIDRHNVVENGELQYRVLVARLSLQIVLQVLRASHRMSASVVVKQRTIPSSDKEPGKNETGRRLA